MSMAHARSVGKPQHPKLGQRLRVALRNRTLRTALEAAMWMALLVAFFYIIWQPPKV